jgi:transcriptional regulator with XRE-family HTH domain
VDQGRAWAARIAGGIGERIAFYRVRAHLSAEAVAGRCAELGMPSISRVVITKLENGRRETVSTAELHVLAAALGVAPIVLLFPLGHAPGVEVLPGRKVDPWDACRWFAGDDDRDGPLGLWRDHQRIESQIQRMDTYRAHSMDSAHRPPGAQPPLVTPQIFADNIEVLAASLRRVREALRGQGMTPPQLHPETTRILGEDKDESYPGGEYPYPGLFEDYAEEYEDYEDAEPTPATVALSDEVRQIAEIVRTAESDREMAQRIQQVVRSERYRQAVKQLSEQGVQETAPERTR